MKILSCMSGLLLSVLFFSAAQAEDTNFTTIYFAGSGICATCHDGLSDTSGDDVSITSDWGASMMANAAKDPFWKAKFASELNRNANLSSVINDTCSKCHAPMANYEISTIQDSEIEVLGENGILNVNHPMHDPAMNGVSCSLCHQIEDDANLGTLGGFTGGYKINDTKTSFGQYIDIFGQPMTNNTGYTPAYSAHISDSSMCATCHNLKTPFVDSLGNIASSDIASEFPEQMPYTEWEHSIFADTGSNPTSCQDCHMPHTTAKISNRPQWLGMKEGFAKHHFAGANTVMLTMLRDNAMVLDVTSQEMDLGISRARSMLKGSVTAEITSAEVINGELEVRLKLNNESGHKVPTSYPSRRMWIHFKISDEHNNVLFESGRINSNGIIENNDNDVNQAAFEMHYDEITSEDQVQIYETIMEDTDSNITYTLLRAAKYRKDNRLTPKGFDKHQVPNDVAVVGGAFGGDDNFNSGSDEITYRIKVNVTGNLTINVSLNYQPLAQSFVEDLYQDEHLPEIQIFKALYQVQTLKHEEITRVETTVFNNGGVASLLTLSDQNGNGADEFVVLGRRDTGILQILVYDSGTDGLLNTIVLPENTYPSEMQLMPDHNGNGYQEIAVLVRNDSGYLLTLIYDTYSGDWINSIVYPTDLQPEGVVVVDDINGNSYPELLVVGRRSNGYLVGIMYDSNTRSWINTIVLPTDLEVESIDLSPDTTGNGYQELVVMGRRNNGYLMALIYDTHSTNWINTITLPNDLTPYKMKVVPSINGDSTPELMVTGTRTNGYQLVIFYDVVAGSWENTVNLPSDMAVVDVQLTADTNGNNRPEVVALGRRANGNLLGVLYDSSTRNWVNTIILPTDFEPWAMMIIPDINGNTYAELGVSGQRASGYRMVMMYDTSTAMWVNTVSVPSDFNQ